MSTQVAKKTFSIQKSIYSELEKYKNKSKIVNEALKFYLDYKKNIEAQREKYLKLKIKQALDGEFYSININNSKKKNKINYIEASDKLKENLFLAIND